MTKLLFVLSLLVSGMAYAGSANCSSPTAHIDESAQPYNASASDCIISVERTSFTSVQIVLPLSGVSSGDEITVVDATPFQYDQCGQFSCYPAVVTVDLGPGNQVADAGEYDPNDPYRYTMVFQYDGSAWQLYDFY